MEAKKTRLFELTLMNVFFCMLVIFAHISSKAIEAYGANSTVSLQYLFAFMSQRYTRFVVPGFIFMGGLKLFLHKKEKFSLGKFYVKRLRSIVLPYLAWVIIYYLYIIAKNNVPFNAVELAKYFAVGNIAAHLYFVVVIVQFYLLAPLWIKMTEKASVAIMLVFSLMITIIISQELPNIIYYIFADGFYFEKTDRVFLTYLIYWVGGCYAGLNYGKFKEMLVKNRWLITAFFGISTFANTYFSYLQFGKGTWLSFLELTHMLFCMSAVLFFFMLSTWIADKKIKSGRGLVTRAIKRIDGVTYGIYLSHIFVIYVADDLILRNVNLSSLSATYALRTVTVYAVILGGAVIWLKIKGTVMEIRRKSS